MRGSAFFEGHLFGHFFEHQVELAHKGAAFRPAQQVVRAQQTAPFTSFWGFHFVPAQTQHRLANHSQVLAAQSFVRHSHLTGTLIADPRKGDFAACPLHYV